MSKMRWFYSLLGSVLRNSYTWYLLGIQARAEGELKEKIEAWIPIKVCLGFRERFSQQ